MSAAETTTETYTGDTLALVRAAQLSRTCIVTLLPEENISDIVRGAFVRVLLELEDGMEDYRIGLVRGTENGTPYGGFTHDHSVTTTTYLLLDLSGELQGINGCSFQLNSVSNSPVSEMEWAAWQRSTSKHPPISVVQRKAAEIRPYMERAQVKRPRPAAQQAPAPQQPPQQQQSSQFLSAGTTVVNQHATRDASPPSKLLVEQLGVTRRRGDDHSVDSRGAAQHAEDVSAECLRRQVVEEMRERNQLFPKDFVGTKTSLLRILERDIADYLDRVRETMRSHMSNCVVCMDRPPTVISLPCKHKVLCRLCATVVRCCPVCRESVVELFEPVEI